MGIYLVTGQPGHGKTAYAIDKAFKFQKEGREVYAQGVKDLDYEKAGWKCIEDPTDWQSLPDGSVVLLDECYSVFPNRNPGSKVPAHVEAMARHRHRGFDFILIAQQALQLDPFLKGLFEEHVHVRQTSILRSKTKLKRWNQFQSNIQAKCDDTIDWIRPKYVFDYYTSTTKVTTKRSMPMWMRWLIVLIVVLCVVVVFIKWRYDRKIADAQEQQQSRSFPAAYDGVRPTSRSEAEAGAGAPVTYATVADYAKAHNPRIGTMPWTAPIYDQRTITTDPQLFCISSTEGLDGFGRHTEASCTCMTEQGTRYELSQPECRTLARNGPVYNPYKQKPDLQPGPSPSSAAPSPPEQYAAAVQGGVINRGKRALGTFPESPQFETSSYMTIPEIESKL